MEPYHFRCPTCATRLKVRNYGIIGQKLACPKCQCMVVVPPPEGLTPEQLQELLAADQGEQESSQGTFDDIDSILATTSESKGAAPANARGQSPARPAGTRSQADQQAILPGDAWTSTEAQNRRRWIMVIFAALAIIVMVGVALTALVVSRSNSNDTRASVSKDAVADTTSDDKRNSATPPDAQRATDPPAQGDPSGPDESNTEDRATSSEEDHRAADDSSPNDDVASQQPPAEHPDSEPPSNGGEQPSENNHLTGPADAMDSTHPSGDAPSSQLGGNQTGNTGAANAAGPDDSHGDASNQDDSRRLRGLDSLLDPASRLDRSPSGADRLDALDQMLEDTGTSLSEIRTLAATFRALENAGLPKYYFEKSDPLDVEILENLDWPCAGVYFEDTPLQFALADFTRVSGVPVQWNLDAFRATDLRLLDPVTLKATDTDFRQLLDDLVEPSNLAVTFADGELPTIHAANDDEMVQATFELPDVQGNDAEQKLDAFAHSIRVLIAPETWNDESSPAKLERKGRALTVVQRPAVLREIERYIQRIENGRRGVTGQPMDPSLSTARWVGVDQRLQSPFQINSPLPLTLNDLLNRFSKQSGVAVIVDWDAALPAGWTPRALVPGYMKEDTCQMALTQICRSLEMTWQVVDENTIQLTTYERAAARIELDVYPVHKILAGRLTDQALMLALEESLSLPFNRTPELQVLYEPECQCVIVYAPQSVHRQVHAVLQRLGAGLQETAVTDGR